MKIKFRNHCYNIGEENYISEGKEGAVYRVGDYAVKIFFSDYTKMHLKEDDVLRLQNLQTFILDNPIGKVTTEENKFMGVATHFITESGYYHFSQLSKEQFLTIIAKMIEDAKLYAGHHYLISDLQYQDSIFDQKGDLHLVDSGSYSYYPQESTCRLQVDNLDAIKAYLLEEVIDTLLVQEKVSPKKRKKILTTMLEEISDVSDIDDYFREKMKTEENLQQFVKQLKK